MALLPALTCLTACRSVLRPLPQLGAGEGVAAHTPCRCLARPLHLSSNPTSVWGSEGQVALALMMGIGDLHNLCSLGAQRRGLLTG